MATPASFAKYFRASVLPGVRQDCKYRGLMIACGDESFAEAHRDITARAWRLGGCYISVGLFDELADAIAEWLLASIDETMPAWHAAEVQADRAAIELHRYFREWEATRP